MRVHASVQVRVQVEARHGRYGGSGCTRSSARAFACCRCRWEHDRCASACFSARSGDSSVQPWLRAPRTRWRSYEVGAASVPPLRVVGALARTPRCTPRRTRMCRQECGACAAHGQECGVGAPPHLRQLLVFGAQLLGALECRVQARGAGARGQVATRRRLTVVRETRASPLLDSVQLRTRFSTRGQPRLPDAASCKPHLHLRIAPTASQDGCASQDGRTIWVHVVLRWQPAS